MKVQPQQLEVGCVVLTDVMGKSNQPIIPKNTVLTNEHLAVLKAFLVKEVNVSSTLETGEPFIPKEAGPIDEMKPQKDQQDEGTTLPFMEHYLSVVRQFKSHFLSSRHHVPINILELRQLLIPLIKRNSELKRHLFTVQNDVTHHTYIYHHAITLGLLSSYLAKQMNYLEHEWIQVGLAGALSNIGMAKLDETILNQERPLTESERDRLKNHPVYSYRLLENNAYLSYATKLAVLQHHERMDGSGYPLGLTGKKIHPFARIIAVCDAYYTMTCAKVHGSPFLVFDELEKEQFLSLDPQAVHELIRHMVYWTIGLHVKLSNQQQAEVIFIDETYPTKPMVKLNESGDIIALKDRADLHISEVLTNSNAHTI